jgi:maleamate amidohydrolase
VTSSPVLPWEGQTRSAYLEGGLASRLGPPGRPAVVVVDLQRGFTEPEFAPGWDATDVVTTTRSLLDAARTKGLPVIFTTIAFPPSRLRTEIWLEKMPALGCLIEGSPAVEIDDRLGRRPEEEVVVKRAASAFGDTGLHVSLRGAGADSVILCGATTSGCVRATAIDAVRLGYRTFVPRECVADRASGPHEASLFDMDAKYADVVALEWARDMINDWKEDERWHA